MLHSALCSITFRDLPVEEIISLCKDAGIQGIEWGGDVHVPHGEVEIAREVGEKTRAAGLGISAYGSYYRGEEDDLPFAKVLASAKGLGATLIRVWAGRKSSEDSSPEDRKTLATAIREAVLLADAEGITVALEYHGNTLTDIQESAHQFLREVGTDKLKLFWQPRTRGQFENDIPELKAVLPHLANVHCFHWGANGWKDRFPLQDGVKDWAAYLEYIRQAEGDRYITLEFVKDNDPEQFRADANTLNDLITV